MARGAVRRENHALNALRTLAAVVVVVGHVRDYLFLQRADVSGDPITQASYAVTSLGGGAVIVFFVLSGYFVGGSVLAAEGRGSFTWRWYLSARFTRLWLVLVPAIALTAVLDSVGRAVFPASRQYMAGGAATENGGLWNALGNVFFTQTNLVPAFGTNGPLWSLAYEAVYYLVFPLLFIGWRRRGGVRIITVAVGLVVMAASGLHIIVLFPAWLLGVLVAWRQAVITDRIRGVGMRQLTLARWITAGLLVLAMAADKVSGAAPGKATLATFVVAVVAAGLMALLLTDVDPQARISRTVLSGLSRYAHSSYSLYATHVPVASLLAAVLDSEGSTRHWAPSPLHWLGLAVLIAVLMVVGWAFACATERNTDAVRIWLLREHRKPATVA